ncbi:MAG: AbrB/MazE/SpoVT family DNA-binding domain-containing protein [Acidobacteria bacterium]|nr:AbrB/MazE/SpoVT family DNA-binding domain-containing protein [Acidobacteriota bacterium]
MVKVFKSGNSLAVAIPAEVVRRAGIEPGDTFEPELTGEGVLLRPVEAVPKLSPELARIHREVLAEHRAAYEEIE